MATQVQKLADQVSDLKAQQAKMEVRMTHVETAIMTLPSIKEHTINQTHMLTRAMENNEIANDDRKEIKTEIAAMQKQQKDNFASLQEKLKPLQDFEKDARRAKQFGVGAIMIFGGVTSWMAGMFDKFGKLFGAMRG
jgi:phenylalanyl-tRNA synthetase alpha subunit